MIIVMKQNAPLTVIEQLEQEMRDRGFQVDRSKGSSKVVLGLVGDTSAWMKGISSAIPGWIRSCGCRSLTNGLAGLSIRPIRWWM